MPDQIGTLGMLRQPPAEPVDVGLQLLVLDQRCRTEQIGRHALADIDFALRFHWLQILRLADDIGQLIQVESEGVGGRDAQHQ